jgi:hypothetical protein
MNSSILQPSATFNKVIKTVRRLSIIKTSRIFILILVSFLGFLNMSIGQVKPDKTPPDLRVSGPDTTLVEVTRNPIHPIPVPKVISAYDSVDGPLQGSVIIDSGKVQTNILGIYKVTYSVSDLSGNTATVYRYINIIDTIAPVLTIKGNNPEYLEVYYTFVDQGVTATDNYYTAANLSNLITVNSRVDTSKIGSYTVTYNLTDPSGNKAAQAIRTVIVIDSIAPSLSLNGIQMDSLEVDSVYKDKGVTYSDNYGTVVISTTGTFYTKFPAGKAIILGYYTIIYTATDKSGNKASIVRTVKVYDDKAPAITLKGYQAYSICQGYNYVDPGYTVFDNYDNISSILITVEGSFFPTGTTNPGLFYIRYKATDKSGNYSYSPNRYIQVKPSTDFTCLTSVKTNIDTTICRGTCPYFKAPISGKTYKWSNGDTTRYIQFCPKTDTALTVAITTASGLATYIYGIHLTKYSCVWPGDANYDLKDDKYDLLSIGLAYGDSGAHRTDQTITWYGHYCDDWKNTFKSGANHKHADCNGDGVVDSADIPAIKKNYGSSHYKTSLANGSPSDPPLSITFSNDSAHVGDTVTAVISLGTSSNAVKNAYGLAFGIKYTSKYVKPDRSSADLSNCWLGTPGKNLIYLVYDDTANGILEIAMTRTDHKNVTGYGDLGKLSIVMQDNVGGKTWIDRKVFFSAQAVKLISNDETNIPVYSSTDSMKIYQSGISNKPDNLASAFMIFPNPVHDYLLLYTNSPVNCRIKITDIIGAEIYTHLGIKSVKSAIPVSGFKPGVYFITIYTSDGNITKRFVKN